jgi:hypothetical protein
MSGPAPFQRLGPAFPPAPIIPAALAAGACSEITALCVRSVIRMRSVLMGFPASRAHLAASRMTSRPNACSASQVVLVPSESAPSARPERSALLTGQVAKTAQWRIKPRPSRSSAAGVSVATSTHPQYDLRATVETTIQSWPLQSPPTPTSCVSRVPPSALKIVKAIGCASGQGGVCGRKMPVNYRYCSASTPMLALQA